MEIQDRTLSFAIRVAKFVRKIAKDMAFEVLAKQLLRSATSIGANMKEADGASSRKDFVNKVTIAKKEAQETEYWLEVLRGAEFIHHPDNNIELVGLLSESREITRILASIIIKAKKGLD
ncbi:MAG: four helix bundle protein [Candidatus Margulisiibacteriota bacterium]